MRHAFRQHLEKVGLVLSIHRFVQRSSTGRQVREAELNDGEVIEPRLHAIHKPEDSGKRGA